jgi:RNA polymerase sigma factor (sigma-70 family)
MSDAIDITQYKDKLKQLAVDLKTRYELGLSVQELCSAGYEALQRLAISGRYDSAQGDFWSWAYKYALNRMIHEVSVYGGLSRRQQAARRDILAARVTVRPAEFRPAESLSERDRFNKRWGAVDGTAVAYQLEMIEDDCMTAEDALLETERKRLVLAAFERLLASIELLPKRQRDMIRQRYVDGADLKAVAANFGISESRACHLLRKARETLRLAKARETPQRAVKCAPALESET